MASGSGALQQSLQVMGGQPWEQQEACYKTLLKLLENVVTNPQEPKFRSIKRTNVVIQAKVLDCPGSVCFLQAAGFVEKPEVYEVPLGADAQQSVQAALDALKVHGQKKLEDHLRAERDASIAVEKARDAKLAEMGGFARGRHKIGAGAAQFEETSVSGVTSATVPPAAAPLSETPVVTPLREAQEEVVPTAPLSETPVVTSGPPEAQEDIAQAAASHQVRLALGLFAAPDSNVRGCGVRADRPYLQALQNALGWTVGGYDTRPTPAAADLKHKDRLAILLRYRQPEDPGDPPRIEMYDYLLHTLFQVPVRPVGPEVLQRPVENLEGRIEQPNWVEVDWEQFQRQNGAMLRPDPVFRKNRYPYQLPRRPGSHELQQTAQHWVMWYFRYSFEETFDPGDEQIDADVRKALQVEIAKAGFNKVDFIWYRNPRMSAPELFHVQVFWIVPNS